ncbi:MAG: pyridoxal 5'-phosphate synthase glutaminase subunit PdxT [Coprococcus sp.]|nr:pyridoxal 5'-phosphate synthase glutaminase subunit PdxT [Coprococcus sp.]
MRIGVLAVQGAFAEHEQMLDKLGVDYIELRNADDLKNSYDAIILPGGESTVQGKLLRDSNMFDTIKSQIENGMPVLATCAGLILLASQLEDDDTVHLGTLPVTVKRNAYGRQLGSFHTTSELKGIGEVPMTFIRAPYVAEADSDVEVLSRVDDRIVAVRYGNQFALSFHPELDSDMRIHEAFIKSI